MLYFSYNTNGLQMEMTEAIVQVANAGYQGIEFAFDDDFFILNDAVPNKSAIWSKRQEKTTSRLLP